MLIPVTKEVEPVDVLVIGDIVPVTPASAPIENEPPAKSVTVADENVANDVDGPYTRIEPPVVRALNRNRSAALASYRLIVASAPKPAVKLNLVPVVSVFPIAILPGEIITGDSCPLVVLYTRRPLLTP